MIRTQRTLLARSLNTIIGKHTCIFQNVHQQQQQQSIITPSSSFNFVKRNMSSTPCSKIPDKECPSRSSSNQNPCWNCSEELSCNDLFCAHCKKIQPPSNNNNHHNSMMTTTENPSSIDYFTLMDMPKEFSINPKVLHEKFKELQRVLHPDKFAMKSEVEKKISLMQSAIVNSAYQTLKNTKLRAEYLLKIKEIDVLGPCNHKSVNDVQLPPEFLMDIMEVNECINEIDNDRDQLTEYQMDFNERKRLVVKSIDESFRKEDLDSTRVNIAQLNYIERTLQLVDNKLHQLDLKEHRQSTNDDTPCADCEHNK